MPLRAQLSAVTWAANGVDLREPLKPAEPAKKMGVHEVDVEVQGPGAGRESAVRALANSGLDVKQLVDVTPLPHNGCRPRKRRRV